MGALEMNRAGVKQMDSGSRSSARQSAKRTNESSPAIYRWDQVLGSNLSPLSGRLKFVREAFGEGEKRGSVVRFTDSRDFLAHYPSTEVLGYSQPSASRTFVSLARVFFVLVVLLGSVFSAFSQTTLEVLKLEPPSWWAGRLLNPGRSLIRGENLQGARVQAVGQGFRVVGAAKTNESGTYLFVDIAIAPHSKPGQRQLLIRPGE